MSVVSELNKHLSLELAAHIRYNGHAEIIRFRGYVKLADQYAEESGEELGHANKVIHRIQQLDGQPAYQAVAEVAKPLKSWDIAAILQTDLDIEREVLDSLASLIESAEQENDWETGNILRALVTDTEHHVEWLTRQLTLLEELGKANYLQAQM